MRVWEALQSQTPFMSFVIVFEITKVWVRTGAEGSPGKSSAMKAMPVVPLSATGVWIDAKVGG